MYLIKTPSLYTDRVLVTDEFITRNDLKERSLEDREDKLKAVLSSGDIFPFRQEVHLAYAPWEIAKKVYRDAYIERVESGESVYDYINSFPELVQDFLDYVNFAMIKALTERDISSVRSIMKLSEFLWLMDREDLAKIIEDDDFYEPYGSPAIVKICDEMGIPVPEDFRNYSCGSGDSDESTDVSGTTQNIQDEQEGN